MATRQSKKKLLRSGVTMETWLES